MALRRIKVMRNRRKRRGLGLDGGDGGGGGADVVSEVEGSFGGMSSTCRFSAGGIVVGGAVWTLPPGGCGGTRGML